MSSKRFLIGILSVLLVSLASNFAIQIFLSERKITKDHNQFMMDCQSMEVTLASRAISDRFSCITKHFLSISDRLTVDMKDEADVVPRIERIFSKETENYPQLVDFSYIPNSEGQFWHSSDNKIISSHAEFWGRAYLTHYIKDWKEFWIPPFSISPGLKMAGLVYPLRFHNITFGAFVAIFDLDLLIGHYAYDLGGKDSRLQAIIVDGLGNIISKPGKNVPSYSFFDSSESNDPDWNELYEDIVSESVGDVRRLSKDGVSLLISWRSARIGSRKVIVVSSMKLPEKLSFIHFITDLDNSPTWGIVLIIIFLLFYSWSEYEKARSRAEESQKLYLGLIDGREELLCRMDHNWRIVFANNSCCSFFELDFNKIKDMNFLDLISSSDRIIVHKILSDGLKEGFCDKNWLQNRYFEDGNRWVRWTFSPVVKDDGQIAFIQAQGRDFTEFFSMQREILNQKTAIDDILENTPAVICMVGPDGSFDLVNRMGSRLFFKEDGKNSSGAADLKELALQVYRRGFGYYGQEISIVDLNGKIRFVSFNIVPRKDRDGTIMGVLAVGIDITDQKNIAKKLLEDREKKYLQILENVGDAVIVCRKGDDGIHRVDLTNRAARMIRGLDEERLEGVTLSSIFSLESLKQLERQLLRNKDLEKKREALFLTAQLKSSDDLSVPVEMTVMPFYQDNRAHIMIVMRDISERVELNKREEHYASQLRRLVIKLNSVERDQKRFMANYLHDIVGQNLASVKIRLTMGLRKCSEDQKAPFEEALAVVDEVIRETRGMTFSLSNPLLDQIGFDAALERLCDRLREKEGLTVFVKHDGIVDKLSDSIRDFIYQAVKELLNNVIKHANTDEAYLSVRAVDSFVVLSVEDNGVGFDRDKLIERATENMSFGLFSLRERVFEVGGSFTCRSSEGEGTLVRVKLPLHVSSRGQKL